jgi:AcrR family transcriptional regulator
MWKRKSAGKEAMEDERAAATEAVRSKKPARDRIFETAREMFYERGIRAVGVESIAAEAGATKMSLYRNFPSKDELVAECLRDQARESWEWWDAAVARHPSDPRAQLEALFDAFGEKACCLESAFGCALSNAAIELHEADNPARIVSVEHKREMHARLMGMAKAAGAPDDDLADGLMMLMEGAYLARATLSNDGPVRAVVRTAKALIKANLPA